MDLTTVSQNEAVFHSGMEVQAHYDLDPSTSYEMHGESFMTLPEMGEQYSTVCTVNDVHFGETAAGKMDGSDLGPVLSVEPHQVPYPEVMNRGAVEEISRLHPEIVVAKGDLTSDGTEEEIAAFMACYGEAFGDRLVLTRGNHDVYRRGVLQCDPMIEVTLDGVVLAVLDTARTGRSNGDLSDDQIEWLDELGARSDRPVMVFAHHPVWDPANDPRTDEFFGLVPDATEQLVSVIARRQNISGYFAGHTHRNRVIHQPGCGSKPFVEVACVKDFPGSWAEYRICDRGIVQLHHRISTPDALKWSERCRQMFEGVYPLYAFGELADRCFAFNEDGLVDQS